MLNYKLYKTSNNPQSLVIFLHGYNGNINDHQYAIDWLKQKLKKAYLIAPEAPEICDKNPEKKQWFGMTKHDPLQKRKDIETSTEEIIAIYNKTHNDIAKASLVVNNFITALQQKLHIYDNKTYLVGFSQGAMLAIYTGLKRKPKLAGVFSIAGLIAAEASLELKINSLPNIYLLHGQDDTKVQFKTLLYTENWLKKHQIPVEKFTYPHLKHQICEDEVAQISNIINGTA